MIEGGDGVKKIKVLMIGNHQSVKGGITSVIQQLLSFDWDSVGVEMKFIPTYIEASGIKKIAYFIRAYMNIEKEIKGRIIQINSKSGKVGSKHNSGYSAAKFGGIGLSVRKS